MLGKPSSFLRISQFLILILLSLALTNCKADEVWGYPVETARNRLKFGDYSFLRHLDLSRGRSEQVFRLGPGAPYYLYFIFLDLGLEETARQMLHLQWDKGKGIWRDEAAVLILEELRNKEDYSELERLGRYMRPRLRNPEAIARCERLITEAYYWQEKDIQLRRRLARLDEEAVPAEQADPELVLFRAVSGSRREQPGWPEQFRYLFYRHRASSLHLRAHSFLELEERYRRFSPVDRILFEAKALLYSGRAAEALEFLEEGLPRLEEEWLEDSPLIAELGIAYFSAGELARGAGYLKALAESLPRRIGLEALEYSGRLYRKLGDYALAYPLFSRVISETDCPEQRDRSIWFLLDMVRSYKPDFFLEELAQYASCWDNPPYFDDILGDEISRLVAEGEWPKLARLYGILQNSASAGVRSRLSYLMGRAVQSGFIDPEKEGYSSQALFEEAMNTDPEGYYELLAAAHLPADQVQWEAENESDPGDPEDQEKPSERERLIWGFLEYGQLRRGYERIWKDPERLSASFLLKCANALQEQGYFLESIKLASAYLEKKGTQPSTGELKLVYPRGYLADIEEVAAREGLSETLVYALVREESHFKHDIVSSAGAIGLTQLLPETARDMARLLRVPNLDLEDPSLNLRLGLHHLKRLLDRLNGSIPKALMAYNAGLSRVRRWEKAFPGLDDDLLLEALPFRETRNYLRKILVSAVHYGYFYADKKPRETVHLFFPDLGQREDP